MKFSHFIYDYVACDDWDHLENILGYSSPKEYLGFDIPFDFEELFNNKSPRWDELRTICEKYASEHGLKVVDTKETYHDLEKGYEDYETVFSFDGKLYLTEYYCGPWSSPYEHGYPEEAKEVFPHKETITVTKYY